MSETTDPTRNTTSVEEALTSPLHLPHAAAECPKCFTELQGNRDFWLARPDGSRLVGLVVSLVGRGRGDAWGHGLPSWAVGQGSAR